MDTYFVLASENIKLFNNKLQKADDQFQPQGEVEELRVQNAMSRPVDNPDSDPAQIAIDRARAQANATYLGSSNALSRMQTARLIRFECFDLRSGHRESQRDPPKPPAEGRHRRSSQIPKYLSSGRIRNYKTNPIATTAPPANRPRATLSSDELLSDTITPPFPTLN
jgi:hypothetical protein